jgi:hypothetical protein
VEQLIFSMPGAAKMAKKNFQEFVYNFLGPEYTSPVIIKSKIQLNAYGKILPIDVVASYSTKVALVKADGTMRELKRHEWKYVNDGFEVTSDEGKIGDEFDVMAKAEVDILSTTFTGVLGGSSSTSSGGRWIEAEPIEMDAHHLGVIEEKIKELGMKQEFADCQ